MKSGCSEQELSGIGNPKTHISDGYISSLIFLSELFNKLFLCAKTYSKNIAKSILCHDLQPDSKIFGWMPSYILRKPTNKGLMIGVNRAK